MQQQPRVHESRLKDNPDVNIRRTTHRFAVSTRCAGGVDVQVDRLEAAAAQPQPKLSILFSTTITMRFQQNYQHRHNGRGKNTLHTHGGVDQHTPVLVLQV